MASQEAIQNILKAEYSSARWKAFLSELFTSSNMFSSPMPIAGINTAIATQALHIGSIALDENGISRNIAVYEVTLAQNVVLERNRVGLRNLLKQAWKEQDAAFIVYHKPGDKNWRFSYVSELKKFNEAGEYVANNTEPKRYTYVLGETESCRTASERFYALQQKASNATLDDVKEAFSVEKLSKTFFADYKVHYQDFVQYLTGKRLEKVAGKWEEVKKHDPSLQMTYIFHDNEKDVRDFCKKLLGRIVFLYFIQKKGWLGVPLAGEWGSGKPDFMSRLLANCANPAIFYSQYLSKLFFETLNQKRENDLAEIIVGEPTKIPYLNGGLFEEDNPKHRDLVFETNLFKNLFDFFDQYNFTIYEDDPSDHTVAVDPEMLGHIFENLLEDNKDKGAFYTPKEIVHYMCQESLIEYLSTWFTGKNYQVTPDNFVSFDNNVQTSFISANEGRIGQGMLEITQATPSLSKIINRSLIEKLLKKQLSDDDKLAVIEHADEFNEALDKVKICDPAIGSGAFPMGLLQEIFTAKQTIHTFTHGDLTTFEPANIKLNIIQNSIYGVDIERGAVDIARLRFWLSLVVDEPAPQALPNLDYKIVVGNSLISKLGDDVIEIDWDIKPNNHGLFGTEESKSIQSILKQLTSLQKDFFNPSARKKDHAKQIRNLKIELLISQLNLKIATKGLRHQPRETATLSHKTFVAQTKLHLQTQGWLSQVDKLKALKGTQDTKLEFFDWQLNFAEVMNKDVVESGKVGFDIVIGNPPYGVSIKNEYRTDVVNHLGNVPDYEIYYYFIEIAHILLKNGGVNSYIIPNTFLFNVFAENYRKKLVDVWTIECLIDCTAFKIFDAATVLNAITVFIKGANESSKVGYKSTAGALNFVELSSRKTMFLSKEVILNSNKNWGLLFKLKDSTLSLVKKICTNKLLIEDLFDVSQGYIPYRRADLIETYGEENGNKIVDDRQWHSDVKESDDHRQEIFGENLSRYSYTTTHSFVKYGKHLAGYVDLKYFTLPRVLLREITSPFVIACYIEDEYVNDPQIINVIPKNAQSKLKYLLGLLNSKLATFYHFNSSPKATKGAFPKILVTDIKNFPIPKIAEAKQQLFIPLVDDILIGKKTGKDTSVLEQRIDNMVYKLYDLTFDEVKLIDPEFALTEAEYNLVTVE